MKKIIPSILAIILVTAMTMSSELLNEKEIIFPEITALAIGYMVAPKRSWKVNDFRMLTLITFSAVIGLCISRFLSLDVYVEIIIAFIVSQVIFMYSGTTFAPLVSAIVLPVMLQTTSIIYPIAAFVMTLIIIVLRNILLHFGIRDKEEYTPVVLSTRADIIDTFIRIICVILVGYIAFKSGFKYVIAPPLLVAFTEFSRTGNKAIEKPVKTVTLITFCALIGAGARYMLEISLGMPLTIAAIVATIIVMLLINYSKMFMPPAGAITILAMLIPDEAVVMYPIQIFIGSIIIVMISRNIFVRMHNI